MQINPAQQSPADNYKLITNLIIPRPIAWITSLSSSGVVNLAPFSFFNAIGADPLYVVIGIGQRDSGEQKDTAKNIEVGGDFVVNLVTENLLDAMTLSAADFPPDKSEIEAAGLNASPSVHVKAPRLAEAEVSLECRLFRAERLGAGSLYIGEVVLFHVADRLMGPRLHVNGFAPLGRLGSPATYCRTTDRFEAPRIRYTDWAKK